MQLKSIFPDYLTPALFITLYTFSEFPNFPIIDADAEPRTKRKKIQRQLDSFFNKPVDVGKGIMSRHILQTSILQFKSNALSES